MSRLGKPIKVMPNIIPMIDIVSMLVIFFMLASQFISADIDFQVKLPVLTDSQAKGGDNEPSKLYLNLRANETDPTKRGELGEVSAGPVNVTARARELQKDWSEALADRLREYDRWCKERHVAPVVVIRADKRLQWRFVLQVMGILSVARIDDVRLSGPVDPRAPSE